MSARRDDPGGSRPARSYLVIAGETASGKSELALEVAERLGGEIVVADSRQVYRGLDIGTAKPDARERARVPHHLIDVVEVGRPFNAADYAQAARRALVAIESRGKTAIVCGGTGFYLAALAGALDPLPPASADAGEDLAGIPAGERHDRLAEVDPALAARIHPHDRQRVDRGLAYWLSTGAPLSTEHHGGAAPLDHVAVRIVWPRAEIRARIEARLDAMLARGLEAEARRFFEAGLTPRDPGLDSIGYQEWWPFFEGRIDRAAVRERILTATRRYAKRQRTWFRHQGSYRAVPGAAGADGVLEAWSS